MSELCASDDTVVVEHELAEPPEKVWQALTAPELVAQWLLPEDGTPVECQVIESQPARLLRCRWREAGDSLDSIVTFELGRTPAGGTHLRIIHTAFEQMPALAMAA